MSFSCLRRRLYLSRPVSRLDFTQWQRRALCVPWSRGAVSVVGLIVRVIYDWIRREQDIQASRTHIQRTSEYNKRVSDNERGHYRSQAFRIDDDEDEELNHLFSSDDDDEKKDVNTAALKVYPKPVDEHDEEEAKMSLDAVKHTHSTDDADIVSIELESSDVERVFEEPTDDDRVVLPRLNGRWKMLRYCIPFLILVSVVVQFAPSEVSAYTTAVTSAVFAVV